MLGDSINYWGQVDLNRFYLSTMAGYYPLERNAFDVTRKRCQKRKLREAVASKTILIVCVTDFDAVAFSENNIVRFKSEDGRRSENRVQRMVPYERKLAWNALYMRDSA